MFRPFEQLISLLFQPEKGSFCIFDPTTHFVELAEDDAHIARSMNAAFLISLGDENHPGYGNARSFLDRMGQRKEWTDVSRFYQSGIAAIHREIEARYGADTAFAARLDDLIEHLSRPGEIHDRGKTAEMIWTVFFPEGAGIRDHETAREQALRQKRMVNISDPNAHPIRDPAREMLFTSNVLLTIPMPHQSMDDLPIADHLKEALGPVIREPQKYWYDHPIPLGVAADQNEILYGLRGLDETLEAEWERGNLLSGQRMNCLLSVSVTHPGLHRISKDYIRESLAGTDALRHIDLFVFTEPDTQMIREEILIPAATHYLRGETVNADFDVFGVDGEYGRHYSFLKAIAAYWQILIEPEIRATFKIDLDQVFPQKALIRQTGASAFGNFKTPLWGARGTDSKGKAVELGMIAGALVNEKDIHRSIYFPDVTYPADDPSMDELFFFSALPQALSTQAEMGTRYQSEDLDGTRACIQRVHVTGGTNGILVDSLRRHRPFTPSFVGRAEDQAYIMSVFANPEPKLAYVHKDGLIMRHDKSAFAQEAMASASVGKLIGDYVRILYFSAYAQALSPDVLSFKDAVDPFTGCFISMIPTTLTYLRFYLKAASLFDQGKEKEGLEFVRSGAGRLNNALDFVQGKKNRLTAILEKERRSWNLYYDTLTAIDKALKEGDDFAVALQQKAGRLLEQCVI
ncbi:MAG: hypothetical protein JRJ85_04300 [Deltaproteobacteria bacterium]|nr:hypothetical protein [Deltaproteobacteria bacterium]